VRTYRLNRTPRLVADEMKTENRTGAYTKAVGRFVPGDDLATATAGDPESVASNLNRGRGSRQFTSAKLVESFGDTRPVHRTSVGNVGASDDQPSGTCRETYLPPSRRLVMIAELEPDGIARPMKRHTPAITQLDLHLGLRRFDR
jgi:hypothetical protein